MLTRLSDRAWTWPPREATLIATFCLTTTAMVTFGVAPLVAPGIVVATSVLYAYWVRRDAGAMVRSHDFQRLVYLLPFLGFALLSWFWSPQGSAAIAFVSTIAISAACAAVIMAFSQRLARDAAKRMAVAFVVSYALVSVVECFETSSGMFLQRLLRSKVALLQSPHVDGVTRDGWIVVLSGYLGNKSMAWLVLLFWPALLASKLLATKPWQQKARMGLIALVVLTILRSEHETSKFALLATPLVFLAGRVHPRLPFRLVAIGWITACVMTVPVLLMLWKAEAFRSNAIQHSGQHRIVIWGYTAEQTMKMPILGHGIGATRFADDSDKATAPLVDGTKFKFGTNVHSHNIYLQTWHELGLIGALLLAFGGVPALQWLRQQPAEIAPYGAAAFATAMVVASLSWSLLAVWYIAMFAFVAISVVTVADLAQRHREGRLHLKPSP